jgi:cytidylate kinase
MSAWFRIQDQLRKEQPPKQSPTVTISRQYGAEAYPLAETLKPLLERKTGDPWTVFDKTLIERVSQDTGLSARLLGNLGDISKPLDEIIGTLGTRWKTHSDAYRLLARQVVSLANQGNVIIIGRGGAVLTQRFSNCFHFRLVAPLEYRIQSIQRRLNIPYVEAKKLVSENQKARDKFIESLLNCSIEDPSYYHCVFNSSKSPIPSIAQSILNLMFES